MNTPLHLDKIATVISINPWRVQFMRKAFAARGLMMPPVTQGICVAKPTTPGICNAYCGGTLAFLTCLLSAHAAGLPYLVIYEDDAFPCLNAPARFAALIAEHPIPADCGILCLGDANGASRYRGTTTLKLADCQPVYTPLVPDKAENKGSHALLVFAAAFVPFAQALIAKGFSDCAISMLGNFSNLKAYGLFHHPLFIQHKFREKGKPASPFFLPEKYAATPAKVTELFPYADLF